MLMYAYEGSQKRPDESKLSPAVFCSPSPGFPSGIRAAPRCGAAYNAVLSRFVHHRVIRLLPVFGSP